MPCIVRNLTDDEAITQMVEDNLNQREEILPSERAKALKMQLEAMAHEKVDAQLLGFKINGAQTTKNGNVETFALSAPWEIAENSRMTLSYDAVVSAVSKAITEQEVLSVVFVLEWRGE